MTGWQLRERDWSRLLAALTGLTLLVYLALAFLQPGTIRYDPWVIQDDARQFLSWTPRLASPALLTGDLLADYWHSATPPLVRAVYAIGAAAGLAPTLMARLLPLVLLPLTARAAWRLARLLSVDAPAAFVSAALVMALAIHQDSIFSATPRAASLLLVLEVCRGLVARRLVATLLALTLLALTYPAPALTCLGMTVLAALRLRAGERPGIDRARIVQAALAVLLVGAAIVPFRAEVARWRPVVTLAAARTMPGMGLPTGRTSIVEADGSIGWACSPRMGFLPELASCDRTQFGIDGLVDLLAFLPLGVAARRWLRRRDPDDPRRLFALALAAAIACWAAAALLAFRLHLPSRYSQPLLAPLELLALGTLLAGGIRAIRSAALRGVATGVAGAVILVSFATPVPKFVRPADRAGLARIAALPPGTRIGGIAPDLPMVPAETGRAVLATAEHAIPYELGYYRPLHARLVDSVALVRSPDPVTVAMVIRRHGLTIVAVDPATLGSRTLPDEVQSALPEVPAGAVQTPALARAPGSCRLYRGPALILFDAPCLVRWAGGRAA